jgi:Cof subfamily protein (haloacid dehalogenase superfamily)
MYSPFMGDPQPLPDWRSQPEEFAPFAAVELIAVDLDGSLVQANAPSVLDQIQSVQHGLGRRRGGRPAVKLTYATGRSLTWVASLLAGLRLRLPAGTPIVLYNGSVVVEAHTGRILARSGISPEDFREIMQMRVALGATLYAYGGPADWPTALDALEVVFGWTEHAAANEYDINGVRVQWCPGAIGDSFSPVAVLMDLPDDSASYPRALARLREVGGVSVTTSGGHLVEIRPEGSNKAIGLEVVVRHMGLQRSRVLALGDSDNDAEMLSWAGLAVSVRDATPAALAQSDYVTRSGAAQGALEVLHTVKHARRWFPIAARVS